MRKVLTLLMLGWLMTGLMTELALAQSLFRWTDEDGQVHYGHAVPAEHRHRGYERLAPDGRVIERIDRALTREERAEEARRRAEQAELEELRATQALIDRRLLASYRTVEDIEATRQTRLTSLQSQQNTLERSLQLSRERFEEMVGRAGQQDRAAEPLSPALESAITEAQAEIRRLSEAIEEIEQRKVAVDEGFDAEVERFRELKEIDD